VDVVVEIFTQGAKVFTYGRARGWVRLLGEMVGRYGVREVARGDVLIGMELFGWVTMRFLPRYEGEGRGGGMVGTG